MLDNKEVNMQFIKLFLIFSVPLLLEASNKYSQQANIKEKGIWEDRPFRVNRLNAVWEKAKKRLDTRELHELHTELTVQDRLELDLKQRKHDGFDEDGEHAALVRRKLMGIVERFKVADGVQDRMSNYLPDDPRRTDLDPANRDEMLKLDKKLGKIWKKAQISGFSDTELEKLRIELLHQQEKMDEYNMLKDEIKQFQGPASDNSVHRFKDEEQAYRQKKSELKKKYADMKDTQKNLDGYMQREHGQDPDFNEPRVIDLWMLAKKANFTDMELDSFKEELKHFEHKLQKQEYLKKELEIQTDRKESGKNNNARFGGDHEQMQRRVEEYDRRIKKHHTELKTRVAEALKFRSEL